MKKRRVWKAYKQEYPKVKDKILSIQNKFKAAEGRYEYGEMNITKLNQRIDDVEDEIYREKLKIKKVADELGETFDDMIAHYWPTIFLSKILWPHLDENRSMSILNVNSQL